MSCEVVKLILILLFRLCFSLSCFCIFKIKKVIAWYLVHRAWCWHIWLDHELIEVIIMLMVWILLIRRLVLILHNLRERKRTLSLQRLYLFRCLKNLTSLKLHLFRKHLPYWINIKVLKNIHFRPNTFNRFPHLELKVILIEGIWSIRILALNISILWLVIIFSWYFLFPPCTCTR